MNTFGNVKMANFYTVKVDEKYFFQFGASVSFEVFFVSTATGKKSLEIYVDFMHLLFLYHTDRGTKLP